MKPYLPTIHYRTLAKVGYSLLMVVSLSLQAQVPGSNLTPLERPELKPLEENVPQTLPPLPELPALPKGEAPLSTIDKIQVTQFKFEGNHVFTAEQLTAAIPKTYLQRPITAEELQEVKNRLTQFYIDHGYVNSGVIIPDQPVREGIITLKVIEGKLVQIEVSGNKTLRDSYLKNRIAIIPDETLDLNQLQEKLQLLQQNPLIKYINAELGPGVQLGEANLKLGIAEEERPYTAQFTFNNHRSPSVGAERGEVELWHRNLTGLLGSWFGQKTGMGDTLYLRYGLTKGLKDYGARYDLPLNILPIHYPETTIFFNMDRSDSEVVEEPFKQIDVESEADTYAAGLSQPLYKTPSQEVSLGLRVEKRQSKTFLLGRPFSFSPGVKDGESHISVIRFSLDGLKRSSNQVLAARSSLNFGIDAWDATINNDGTPDGKFFTWLAQFQWVRRLDYNFITPKWIKDSQIIFRTDLQWAKEDLLPLEKFSIGGSSTVRGYRENFLTRDSGVISSLEWRVPVYKWCPFACKNPEDGQLHVAVFTDYGRSWNADSSTPDPKYIYSAGLGLRYTPNQYTYAELYWGKALKDVEDPEDEDIQDNGIHFEMYVKFGN